MRSPLSLALVASFAGAALFAIGAVAGSERAAVAYLVAYLAVLLPTLGVLFLEMFCLVTGARWFVPMRRIAERVIGALPLLALLFAPVVLLARFVYPWARPEGLDTEAAAWVHARHGFVNVPFFAARSAFYLLSWALVGERLRRLSRAQDGADAPTSERLAASMRRTAAAGIPLAGLTLTFAAFDWAMSLEPGWQSSIFGIYLFAGAMFSAMALIALLVYAAKRSGVVPPEVGPSHVQAVGKLMLTFLIFWAYAGFSQLLLIWIADLPDEVPFYVVRTAGGWAGVSAALGVVHFVLPFLALLSWRLKRSAAALSFVAAWALAAHYLDMVWLVVPARVPGGPRPALADFGALLMLAGPTIAFALWRGRATPSVAADDPAFAASLRYEDS